MMHLRSLKNFAGNVRRISQDFHFKTRSTNGHQGLISTLQPKKTNYGNEDIWTPKFLPTSQEKFKFNKQVEERSNGKNDEFKSRLRAVMQKAIEMKVPDERSLSENSSTTVDEQPSMEFTSPKRSQPHFSVSISPVVAHQQELPPATTSLSTVKRGLPSDRYRGLTLLEIFHGKTNDLSPTTKSDLTIAEKQTQQIQKLTADIQQIFGSFAPIHADTQMAQRATKHIRNQSSLYSKPEINSASLMTLEPGNTPALRV